MSGLKYPASIDWEVTPYCNHNCIHCYNCWRSNEDKSQDILFNRNVTSEWYNNISELIIRSMPVSVIITGGEPLSVFWKMDGAIERLIQSGIYVSMNTNLTLLTDSIADRISELGIHIFTSIPSANSATCDKITGVRGSFERIDQGIKICLEHGIPLASNMVVTKINEAEVYQTAKYIKDLGMDYFCCTKAAFPANAQESLRAQILTHNEFRAVLSELIRIGKELNLDVDSAWAYSLCGLEEKHIPYFGRKRRCGAGRFNFAITFTGDIKACNVDTSIYGNILSDTFGDVIKGMKEWQTGEFLPRQCRDCKSLYLCGGGCRLEAENTFGDKCHLDSTADISNKERTIEPPKQSSISTVSLYEVKSNIRFVKEENCYRISLNSMYEFITNECKDFLDEHPQFLFSDFRDQLGLLDEIAKFEISEFLDKGFISEVKK